MPRRPHHHLPLNVSTLDSSKHSVGGTSASVSPGGQPPPQQNNAPVSVVSPIPIASPPKIANGNATGVPSLPAPRTQPRSRSQRAATEEALTSLALLCLVSLLLALLALLFLLKISAPTSGTSEEFAVVYEVTLALCALTLSLNLCCLLVCAIQFLFAVKLVHSPSAPNGRSNKYLQKSAVTRVCAVGGFFISIPVFLTGIILYTFIQFHSTPAIVTSVFIGIGIVFCGCAMVHNVFVWQKEKTNLVKAFRQQDLNTTNATQNMNTSNGVLLNGHLNNTMQNLSFHSMGGNAPYPITLLQQGGPYIIRPPTSTPPGEGAATPGVPPATIDLSHDTHELSTLV
ncbi:jiraiya domain-containing protein [Phthorimaea operculella]|nr:jiraiya domain-containing protein [Phthorimaea operculella]